MILWMEIADLLFLLGSIYVIYDTNKKLGGTWILHGVLSLLLGGVTGMLLGRTITGFDGDFFAILMTFVFALALRPVLPRFRKKK